MAEYEMPMEEQVKLLVKTVASLDKKVGALYGKFDAIDKRFDAVDKRFDAVDTKFDKIDQKFGALDQKFGALDQKFDKMMVRLDDTHAVAKLGLEAVQGLRESMDDNFEKAAKANADQTDLLKSVLVHVRKRVEVLERPKPRRRRRS